MTWESWRLPYQICPRSPWGQHPAQKFPQESKPKFHLPPIFFFFILAKSSCPVQNTHATASTSCKQLSPPPQKSHPHQEQREGLIVPEPHHPVYFGR